MMSFQESTKRKETCDEIKERRKQKRRAGKRGTCDAVASDGEGGRGGGTRGFPSKADAEREHYHTPFASHTLLLSLTVQVIYC